MAAAIGASLLAMSCLLPLDAGFTLAMQGLARGRAPSPSSGRSLRASLTSGNGMRAPALGAQQPTLQAMALGALVSLAGLAAGRRRGLRSRQQKATMRAAMWPFQSPDKKTVIITGASSGVGLACAKEMAQRGDWFVIMACRDFVKAEMVAKENGFPEGSYKVLHCDLAANNSVREFVRAFRTLERPLDALVCNAALYFPNADKQGAFLPGLFPGGGPRWSADGHEMQFAANYLGHFLLCKLLLEDLKNSFVKPARCVILGTVTASVNNKELGGMIPPVARIGDLEGLEQGMKSPTTMVDGGPFSGAKAYKDSKVCDVMLMRELHRRYHKETGVVFSSMYPGCVAETGLFREHYPVFQKLFPDFQKTVTRAYVSNEEAGRRLAACVADPEYRESGSYYSWQGAAGTGGAGGNEAKDNKEKSQDFFLNYGSFRTLAWDEIGGDAGDDARCQKLWDLSEKLVQQD